MSKVMAVILNYNTLKDSIKCSELLKKQDYKDLEIVIVDNGSTDGKNDNLIEYGEESGVHIILNKKNGGFSAGNNIGLRKAEERQCKYALIINPDVEIHDVEYISKAVDKMEKDSSIAVLGTDVVNAKGQHQNPMREISFLEESFLLLELIRNKLSKKIPYVVKRKRSGYCEKVSGCCFFAEMSFIKEIVFLDENVFLYCEEPILAKAVQKAKRNIYYFKEKQAFHNHIESKKGNSKKRLDMFLESRLYYLDKYSGYCGIKLRMVKNSRKKQNAFFYKKHRG